MRALIEIVVVVIIIVFAIRFFMKRSEASASRYSQLQLDVSFVAVTVGKSQMMENAFFLGGSGL